MTRNLKPITTSPDTLTEEWLASPEQERPPLGRRLCQGGNPNPLSPQLSAELAIRAAASELRGKRRACVRRRRKKSDEQVALERAEKAAERQRKAQEREAAKAAQKAAKETDKLERVRQRCAGLGGLTSAP